MAQNNQHPSAPHTAAGGQPAPGPPGSVQAPYPPQGQGGAPPGAAPYPPQQQGAYPPQGGAYPPQGGAYPPQGGAYPPQGGAYPPQSGAYPPQAGAYPPQQGAYPPQQGAYPQYGAYSQQPPQQGYAPPPQAGYGGAPPPQPYGAPSGQQPAYGAPPGQQAPYGAPPAQYGVPPQHQPQAPYGTNPGGGGYYYNGVSVPPPPPHQPGAPPAGYDAKSDAAILKKAMKGFGTDEAALIKADALCRAYKSSIGKDLLKAIESETSGQFENALRAKLLGPLGYDVWLIKRACAGLGTNEQILDDVLIGRTNADLHLLKQTFQATYNQSLDKLVESELSGKVKQLYTMILQADRPEGPYVDPAAVQADLPALASAFRGLGTDELAVCNVLAHRSVNHLAALSAEFQRTQGRTLAAALKDELSGHLEKALLRMVEDVGPDHRAVDRDAKLIDATMSNEDTKKEQLVYRVIRASWDRERFKAIKDAYRTLYKRDLVTRIKNATEGHVESILVAVASR